MSKDENDGKIDCIDAPVALVNTNDKDNHNDKFEIKKTERMAETQNKKKRKGKHHLFYEWASTVFANKPVLSKYDILKKYQNNQFLKNHIHKIVPDGNKDDVKRMAKILAMQINKQKNNIGPKEKSLTVFKQNTSKRLRKSKYHLLNDLANKKFSKDKPITAKEFEIQLEDVPIFKKDVTFKELIAEEKDEARKKIKKFVYAWNKWLKRNIKDQ